MDVDILFALALLVFYLATQFLGRKKRGPQAPPSDEPVPLEYEQQHSAEVEDALREIREALGWPSQQETRQPEPVSTPAQPPPVRPAERKTRLEETRTIRPARSLDRPTFLGEESNVNEWEVAQRRAAKKKADVSAQFGTSQGIPEVKEASRKRPIHPIAQKLRSPQGARDAVVYMEIFQPRWKNDLI